VFDDVTRVGTVVGGLGELGQAGAQGTQLPPAPRLHDLFGVPVGLPAGESSPADVVDEQRPVAQQRQEVCRSPCPAT